MVQDVPACSGCRPGHHANKVSLCGNVPPTDTMYLVHAPLHTGGESAWKGHPLALLDTRQPPEARPNSSGALVDQPFSSTPLSC